MKKNGKKFRRLAKEKQERKIAAEAKAGVPFSRASKKKRLCTHYEAHGGGFIVGTAWSYLYPLSESKCCCSVCRTEFSMEQYHAMEVFVKEFTGVGCTTVVQALANIQKVVPPVWYYKLNEDTVKTVSFEEDQVVLPDNCIGECQKSCVFGSPCFPG